MRTDKVRGSHAPFQACRAGDYIAKVAMNIPSTLSTLIAQTQAAIAALQTALAALQAAEAAVNGSPAQPTAAS